MTRILVSRNDTFEAIGEATASVVEKIRPLGPVDKIAITSRDQWLDMRKNYVTASDIASISGVGRRSPLQVWAEKTGAIPPTTDNNILRRGRWFEAAIFAAIAEERPNWNVKRAGVFLTANDYRLGATPDGLAIIPGVDGLVVIQNKLVSAPVFREKWLTDPDDKTSSIRVPLEYQLQTLTEAMLAGAATAYVVALVVDTYSAHLHLLEVPRHAEAEQRILERVAAFWSDIDSGREPEVMPGQDADVIKALYPQDNGTEIDISGDNAMPGIVDQYVALGKQISAEQKERDTFKTMIAAKLRDAESARLADGRRITFKTQDVAGYEVKPRTQRTIRVSKGGPR